MRVGSLSQASSETERVGNLNVLRDQALGKRLGLNRSKQERAIVFERRVKGDGYGHYPLNLA